MALFGNCGSPHPSFDYVEPSVSGFLNPFAPDDQIAERLANTPRPLISFNAFAPQGARLYGPGPLLGSDYIETACRRAAMAGGRLIGLGAGHARRIPPGWTHHEALAAFCTVLRELGDTAQRFGLTIALEPLNRTEDDLITSLRQGADLVRTLAHPHIRLLADQYHMDREQESYQEVVDAADMLVHAHTAVAPDRVAPRPGDQLAPFFAALKAAGYDGGISVEGSWSDQFDEEAPRVSAYMRETWERAQ